MNDLLAYFTISSPGL